MAPAVTSGDENHRPHVALLPSAGMGHLTPFCRLAASLVQRGCTVSFITVQPTVSSAESLATSRLLSSFPSIRSLNLPLLESDPAEFHPTPDPFFLRMEAISRSAHLLRPLLAEVPVSALVIDITSAHTFVPIANELNLPSYVLFTSSAAMFALFAYFPTYITTISANTRIGDIDVPGFRTVPKSSVPPPLHDPNHLFTIPFVANGRIIPKADGILINTFHSLEPEAMAALKGGRVVPNLPPVFAIGPLQSPWTGKALAIPWLDRQPDKSVVYVSFGSRTAMKAEQIQELGAGLEKSQCRFLWVLKTKKVDKEEDGEKNLEELIGEGYEERVKGRGMVVNEWVEQEDILRHRAVGGFVSHCGWNSVTEAAMAGVRVLAWPRAGDQRVNGEVVRRSGVGVWMEEWWWEAEEGVVSGAEIGRRVREMMEDEELRRSAERLGGEARKAVEVAGSSGRSWEEFISKLMV